jgi:hypothetical protein
VKCLDDGIKDATSVFEERISKNGFFKQAFGKQKRRAICESTFDCMCPSCRVLSMP